MAFCEGSIARTLRHLYFQRGTRGNSEDTLYRYIRSIRRIRYIVAALLTKHADFFFRIILYSHCLFSLKSLGYCRKHSISFAPSTASNRALSYGPRYLHLQVEVKFYHVHSRAAMCWYMLFKTMKENKQAREQGNRRDGPNGDQPPRQSSRRRGSQDANASRGSNAIDHKGRPV